MKSQIAFHGMGGNANFLGLRHDPRGGVEIVFDDGVTRRMVWRVASREVNEQRLGDALRVAVNQVRVLPALYAELKKRAIAIEAVAR